MIKNKLSYIEHITDSEQILPMRRILDKVEKVLVNHSIESTDFLDPYQRKLSHSFLNRFSDISYYEEGGYEEGERKSLIIFPSYLEFEHIENPVGALRISGRFKFKEVTHRDYLGSIMGLGIKREKIGDISIHENSCEVILHKDILDYIKYNLEYIGKEPVTIDEIDLKEVKRGVDDFKELIGTVASLRLDALISTTYNISRESSSTHINNSRVKVNWKPTTQPSFEIYEGDVISLRGYGRFILYRVLGITKKDRIRVQIRILK